MDVLVDNLVELAAGRPMTRPFDGHANCFVESGGGKALLLDFNYDTEPLPGMFPAPYVGPMSLLKESRANHLGQARLPLGVLERPASRAADPAPGHVHGRQAPADPTAA